MFKWNTPPPPDSITRRYIASLVRVLVLAAFLVTAVQISAEASRSLEFVNSTGETIQAIYLNGHSVGGLSNRQSRSVTLGSGSIFDIKIVFSSGRDVYWDNCDLHTVWRITFIRNGSKIRAQWN